MLQFHNILLMFDFDLDCTHPHYLLISTNINSPETL